MKVDSLDELKAAFAAWRRSKKHAREPMPEELRCRAQRATKKHGVRAVVRVTRVERARLLRATPARTKPNGATSKPKAVPKSYRSGKRDHGARGTSWAGTTGGVLRSRLLPRSSVARAAAAAAAV